jgi:hypothetical protein
MREGGGCTKARERGAAAQGEGIRGRAARVRGASGPDQVSHHSSRPQRMSLTKKFTVLLVNASQKF